MQGHNHASDGEYLAGRTSSVSQLEMEFRSEVSRKIELILTHGPKQVSLTQLEQWFCMRRIETAIRMISEYRRIGDMPPFPLNDLLHYLLIDTWNSDGCIGFWNHADKIGSPSQ